MDGSTMMSLPRGKGSTNFRTHACQKEMSLSCGSARGDAHERDAQDQESAATKQYKVLTKTVVEGESNAKLKTRVGACLNRSASIDSYHHQFRRRVLESDLFKISLSSTEESTDETCLLEGNSVTSASMDDKKLEGGSRVEEKRIKDKRKLFCSSLFRRNSTLIKSDEKLSNGSCRSDIVRKGSRCGQRKPKFPFARRLTYDKLHNDDSAESPLSDVRRPPLKKCFSMSDACDEEVIDVCEDELLAKMYTPFCPRRMAICRQMNIPETKQLEMYLVLTRLKQFCFI